MSSLELKIPPLALVVICAVAMWGLARGLPLGALDFPAADWLALGLALTGLVIAFAGVQAFRRHATTVNPMHPQRSTSVVRDGVYGLTRNPMYLGFLFALLGWGLYLGQLSALPLLIPFMVWLTRFQIIPEERALRDRFGADYEHYCRAVRRWI
jgi:protein-S-isoprenylcysteine O-methyltransferase Ste14